jgi:CHASE3 domain sensor protein
MARGLEARRWVAHTEAVLIACDSTLADIHDAEAGQRGYLLTGDRDDLAPYDAGRRGLASDTARLRVLTQDNPTQQRRLDTLERLLSDRVALMDSTIRLRAAEPQAAAVAIVRSGRGRALMDSARTRLAEMVSDERHLLADREARVERVRSVLIAIVSVGGVLAIAIALLTSFLLRAGAVRRAAHARELADANTRLREQQAELEKQTAQLHEQQVALETSNADLQDRTRELEDLAHQLARSDRRLRYILETVPSGIIEADLDGTYIYANAAAERILGLDR